jgi:hypothetical protein
VDDKERKSAFIYMPPKDEPEISKERAPMSKKYAQTGEEETDTYRLNDLAAQYGLTFKRVGNIYRFQDFNAHGLRQALGFAEGFDRARRDPAPYVLAAWLLAPLAFAVYGSAVWHTFTCNIRDQRARSRNRSTKDARIPLEHDQTPIGQLRISPSDAPSAADYYAAKPYPSRDHQRNWGGKGVELLGLSASR